MSGLKSRVPAMMEGMGVIKKVDEYAAKNTTQPAAAQPYKSASGGRASFASRRRRSLMGDSEAVKLDGQGMASDMQKDMMKKMLGE